MSTDAPNGGGQFQDMDPQRIYNAEDLAFFGATIMRSLTAYKLSIDPLEATTLVPDAATDTGRPNADFTQWSFTLRDGMNWQDGSPLKCEDFQFGVSRTFATDVIVGGPTYAIQYLAIPTETNGDSAYRGPFDGNSQDLFDEAVSCSANTITFNLNRPVPDFNKTVTLGFGAVPNPIDHPGVDSGEAYDTSPWSDGPYVITSYSPGAGGSLTLNRNPFWSSDTDGYRGAYPDKWQVDFGLDPRAVDRTLMDDIGNGQFAVDYSAVGTDDVSQIFVAPTEPADIFQGRAFSNLNGYFQYLWIRTDIFPNVKIRQAMAVALNRFGFLSVTGGEFAHAYADGVLAPTIGQDYASTNLWDADGPFGQPISGAGDAALASRLIAASGETAPTVTYTYANTSPTGDLEAEFVRSSLHAAGFDVKLFGAPPSYGPRVGDIGRSFWGADWPDASTVIPQVFPPEGSGAWNFSHVYENNFPEFHARVADAFATGDSSQRSEKWQALNADIGAEAFVIPLSFERAQYLGGSGVGNLYRWAPYASWPYAQLYAKDS